VTGLSLLGLLPDNGGVTTGSAWLAGTRISGLPERDLRRIRGREIALVSQEPMVALDPNFTIGSQLSEVVRRTSAATGREDVRRRVRELLASVHLPDPDGVARRHPHEFSGGMLQRVVIAMALAASPRLLIADEPTTALAEPLLAGADRARHDVRGRVADLLARVGLPEDAADRYPAQFSGGQRQRIAIARAVARQPRIIVCDEPTSALDVTTQAAALNLLAELRDTLGCAYLFITHDLAVVKEFAARTLVLRRGHIVEEGPSAQVCDRPRHEYTRRLVAAVPVPDPDLQRRRREQRLAKEGSAS
jgi:ABC-type glutathione transport system ATPase component